MAREKIERKIAVIFATDVVGYSKHMEANESETIHNLRACEGILTGLFAKHDGRLFNTGGDSFLAEFPSAVSAVECAVEFQNAIQERNSKEDVSVKLEFRIGINSGDVVKEKGNLLGDGVNIAARLEALAQTGGITISKSIYEFVRGKTRFEYNDLGVQKVKQNEFHAFDIVLDELAKRELKKKSLQKPLLVAIGLIATFLIALIFFSGIFKLTEKSGATSTVLDRPRILIETFSNVTGDEEHDFVKGGLRESIITTLSNYSQIDVQSSNTTEYIEKNELSDDIIAKEYGVRYKVGGAYQVFTGQMRVNVELQDISDNSLIWSKKFDFDGASILKVQDKISRNILEELGASLTMGKQAKTWSSYFDTLEQYQLFMDWRSAWQRRTVDAYYIAEDLWSQLKPTLKDDNPLKYGLESWTIVLKVSLNLTDDAPKELEEALALARKCISYGPELPDSHALKAYIESVFFADFENAILSANKVTEIGKNSMDAMAIAAMTYRGAGQLEKSSETYQKIITVAPHAPTWIKMNYIRTLLLLGEFNIAEEVALPLSNIQHLRTDVKSDALLTLAYISMKKNKIQEAQNYFDQQDPEFKNASAESVKQRWGVDSGSTFVEEMLTELKKLGLKD